MSMNLMAKAMSIKVGNPLRKLVLIKLADNANDNGECWPSYQHIADHCECSKSAVKEHISALIKLGLMTKENRVGVNNGKGNTSNVYRLHLTSTPVPPESTPPVPPKSTGGSPKSTPVPPESTPPVPPAAPRTYHSFEPVNEPKNIMFERVRTKCEKSPERHEETDKAFEEIFWCAGMRKAGKKNASSAFRTQFREWRKTTRGTASEFATMLAEDIACRNGKQFGFDRLLPSSYLNGQRWNDEKPETIQP
ncbi:helix-turn-helix domain-containing protein, partial [Salmonella enterica subsp. enterica serovar Mbandaka]